MTLADRIVDIAAERAALKALLAAHPADGTRRTPFHGWRVRDCIGHMATIDALATLALSDEAGFAAGLQAFGAGTAPGEAAAPADDSFRRIAAHEDAQLGALAWPALLDRWDAGFAALADAARTRAAGDRVPWFAGSMRADSLLAARHMEVWAYGQDVFDSFRVRRREDDRVRTVAEFGIKTFGFSFATRSDAVPAAKPFVSLRGPSGAAWCWNDPAAPDRIEGDAADFCLVVTQRRHVEDTGLMVSGATAARWMQIAQCIAGPPHDGPRPGERRW